MIAQIALKILKRNRHHSIRAIYGLSLSIAIVISLISIFSGISLQITQIVNLSGNSTSINIQSTDGTVISSNVLENASMSNIQSIIPIYEKDILFNSSQQLLVQSFSLNLTSYLNDHTTSYIQRGQLPQNQSEFLVSSNLFSRLNLHIGQVFTIDNKNMTLVGSVVDDSVLLNSVIFNTNPSQASFISVVLTNPTIGATTLTYLKNYLGSKFTVSFAKESNSYLTSIFSEILSKFSLILFIIIIISFIRIYFFVLWIIINNINDFLILRILGYSKAQLLALVLSIALIIGDLGLFVGLALGLVLPLILSNIVPLVSHIKYIPYIPDPGLVLLVIILINISIIIGSIKPYFEIFRTNLNTLTNG